MWYWYLLWYLIVGLIAIFSSLCWFVIGTPIRNEYDFGHWSSRLDYCMELVGDSMVCFRNVLGVLWTILLWPWELVRAHREFYPEVERCYRLLLIYEAKK